LPSAGHPELKGAKQAHTPEQLTTPPTAALDPLQERRTPIELRPPGSMNVKVLSLPEKDPYEKFAIWCTFGLVVVGAGGTIAAVASLRAIRKQADLMRAQSEQMKVQSVILTDSVAVAKRSAEAAEATVETMKRSERSWLREKINFVEKLPRRSEGGGGLWMAVVTIKNVGERPAFIKIAHTRLHTTTRLPDVPEYKFGAIVPDGQILEPGGEAHLRCLLEEGSLDDDQIDSLEGQISTLSA
jgi:hypothetical protein